VAKRIQDLLDRCFLIDANHGDQANRDVAAARLTELVREWNGKAKDDVLRNVPFWKAALEKTLPHANWGKSSPFKVKYSHQGIEFPLFVWVPKTYDPKKAYPLVLTVFDAGQDNAPFFNSQYGDLRESHIVVGAVRQSLKDADKDPYAGNSRSVMIPLVYALPLFHIDRDRVVLDGFGKGADDAAFVAADFAIQFAGAILRAPTKTPPLVRNLGLFPTMIIAPAAGTAKAIEEIRKACPEATVLRAEDAPAGFASAAPEVQKWIAAIGPRRIAGAATPYTWWTHSLTGNQRWGYWFKVREDRGIVAAGPDLPVRVSVALVPKYNLVEIDCSNVAKFDLYLNDEVLDLEWPYVVRVNGGVVFRSAGRALRTVENMLGCCWTEAPLPIRTLFAPVVVEIRIPPELQVPPSERPPPAPPPAPAPPTNGGPANGGNGETPPKDSEKKDEPPPAPPPKEAEKKEEPPPAPTPKEGEKKEEPPPAPTPPKQGEKR